MHAAHVSCDTLTYPHIHIIIPHIHIIIARRHAWTYIYACRYSGQLEALCAQKHVQFSGSWWPKYEDLVAAQVCLLSSVYLV